VRLLLPVCRFARRLLGRLLDPPALAPVFGAGRGSASPAGAASEPDAGVPAPRSAARIVGEREAADTAAACGTRIAGAGGTGGLAAGRRPRAIASARILVCPRELRNGAPAFPLLREITMQFVRHRPLPAPAGAFAGRAGFARGLTADLVTGVADLFTLGEVSLLRWTGVKRT
jgi:hypothetical protein